MRREIRHVESRFFQWIQLGTKENFRAGVTTDSFVMFRVVKIFPHVVIFRLNFRHGLSLNLKIFPSRRDAMMKKGNPVALPYGELKVFFFPARSPIRQRSTARGPWEPGIFIHFFFLDRKSRWGGMGARVEKFEYAGLGSPRVFFLLFFLRSTRNRLQSRGASGRE